MLKRLYIKNFVIIKELALDLDSGLSVITGNTGSGKSLILDAINFCINGTGNTSLISYDSNNLQVIMTFKANGDLKNFLDENGIIIDEDEIIISRILSKDGKKRSLINNQPVTQKIIDLLSPDLVTIYAQHSLSSLFKQSYHIKFLDNFVGNQELIGLVESSYNDLRATEKELAKFKHEFDSNARELDFLMHMRSELITAKIQSGEEEDLRERKTNLQNIGKKIQTITESIEILKKSDCSNSIYSSMRTLLRAPNNDLFSNVIKELDLAYHHLSLGLEELSSLAGAECNEQQSLEQIEDRLFMIKDIARKYKCNSSEIPNLLRETEEKIEKFENSELIIKKLEQKLTSETQKFRSLAERLSKERQKAGAEIEKNVIKELSYLDMKSCDFKVKLENLKEEKYSSRGIDNVSFEASTNPGSPFSAIDKIASGGEMARFMLALQVSLLQAPLKAPSNKSGDMRLIIFDEIDTGIGGKVADSVGERLKKLSKLAQVLVITHQPQVASKSDIHILVTKEINLNKTESSAKTLNELGKTEEIARMLSGKNITDASLLAAKQLIAGS